MMAAQADAACEAVGTTGNGFRECRLETQVGTVTHRIPKLRQGTYFLGGTVERRSRVEVICAVAEMYAMGVSARKVGGVLECMGPTGSRRTRSRASARRSTPRWRTCAPGSCLRYASRACGSTRPACPAEGAATARPVAVAAAIAVGEDGVRRVVGPACVDAEPYTSRKGFLRGLRERGLSGVQCVTSDAHGGIVRAVRELFPGAA